MTIFCATGNQGKLREFREAAAGRAMLEPVPGFSDVPACEETGATFEENAIQKALHYGARVEGLLFAEDSGIEVAALGGAPGVYSARFSGPGATDASNNALLVKKLRGAADRKARYVCVIALVRDGSLLATFRGEVEGRILEEPRGSGGFGYDPYFFYEPFGCTFAEVPAGKKFEVSHRGNAFRKMMGWMAPAGQ